ncbi:MAG: hypothetical protein WBB34_01370 [Xanthobacteraceae bacterium]
MDEPSRNRSLQADQRHTGDDRRNGEERRRQQRKEKLDDALDVGLEETFPGSDPVSVVQPPSNVHEKNER